MVGTYLRNKPMDKIFKKDTRPVQANHIEENDQFSPKLADQEKFEASKNYVIKRHINVLKKLAK